MVNPAINAALIAAAQQQAVSEGAITSQLAKAGATNLRAASALDLSAKGSDKALAMLVKRGHVREAGGGRYWLDEEAAAEAKSRGVRAALVIAAFLLSVTISIVAVLATR